MKVNFVIVVKRYATETLYAYVESTPINNNLKSIFEKYEHYYCDSEIDFIQYCASHKEAEKIARNWNDSFKRNGELTEVW